MALAKKQTKKEKQQSYKQSLSDSECTAVSDIIGDVRPYQLLWINNALAIETVSPQNIIL